YFLQRDDSGRITSAQLDPAAANKLKSCLEKNISLELEKLGEEGIDIPIGTLTGINYLSGKGGGVNIGIAQIGSASSELNSVFESAGINQTRLRLSVTVTVTISAILPTGSTKIRMKEEYLLCDSLIVGEVPEKYGGEGVYL
ncbi:MAG: sporulation protein YunB, partial [Ruminococcus sp.]|nr:sporulation protein YunB [Ruminococcus sp.]